MDHDSTDVDADALMPKTPDFLLTQVLGPVQACLGTVTACQQVLLGDDSEEDVLTTVQGLLGDLEKEGKLRTSALQSLYLLTDSQRQTNRRILICNTRFNLMKYLAPCLSPSALSADRRRALLIIANLCIPVENKAVILLGDPVHDLLPALLEIIRSRLEDSYLATACLFNLSQLEDGKPALLYFAATPPDTRETFSIYQPYDNPYSVLRTLETLLLEFAPFLAASTSVSSVQSEAFRWSMGTLRHAVTQAGIARVVATQTTLPSTAVACLDLLVEGVPRERWTRDSLPDACLMFLVHLAQHEACLPALQALDYAGTLEKFQGQGIHELRARTLYGVLGQESNDHPAPSSTGGEKSSGFNLEARLLTKGDEGFSRSIQDEKKDTDVSHKVLHEIV